MAGTVALANGETAAKAGLHGLKRSSLDMTRNESDWRSKALTGNDRHRIGSAKQ